MSEKPLKKNELSTKSILKSKSKDSINSPLGFSKNSPEVSPDSQTREISFEETTDLNNNSSKSKNGDAESTTSGAWADAWTGTECLNKCDLLSIFTLPMNLTNITTGSGGDLKSIISSLEESNPKTDVATNVLLLEKLMSEYGLPGFAFLPTSTGKASVGKKCAVWNKSNDSKVEIRIRTGAELRRLRFVWEDVLILQIGPRIVDFQEDQDNDEAYHDDDGNSVQSKTITEKRRFVSCEVRGKGFVDLFFGSEKLAAAVFHGWSHIVKEFKSKSK